MLDRDTADAIAQLTHQLRPDWDIRGIMSALAQLRDREPSSVALAAIRAAADPNSRTPAIIALDGEHWRDRKTERPQPPPHISSARQPDRIAHNGAARCRAALEEATTQHGGRTLRDATAPDTTTPHTSLPAPRRSE